MPENAEKMDALFVNLVLLFKNAAMQQMGKIMNPVTGKIEKSLEQARFSIDMLEMLKEKTRGNLSEDLGRLLDSTLLEMRMNYVEEAEAAAKEEASAEAKEETAPTKETKEAPDGEGEQTAAREQSQESRKREENAAGAAEHASGSAAAGSSEKKSSGKGKARRRKRGKDV